MSKPGKKRPVPELRFPEYRAGADWEVRLVADLGKYTGGGTPSRDNADYWNGSIPWISSSDISQDSIRGISISRYISNEALEQSATKLVPSGSVVLVARVGVGKVAVLDRELCTSQDFISITPTHDRADFIAYCFKSHTARLLSLSQGMAITGFTKEDLSKMEMLFPSARAEQQKIAACLSTVDALLAAESVKLEALRAHKKGLMQQLFPAVGAKAPALRFPGFKGEWGEIELAAGLIGQPQYGMNAPAVKYSEELPTYLRITDISEESRFLATGKVSVDREATEDEYMKDGDIALARTGASVGKSYKYKKSDGALVFAGFLIRVRPNPKVLDSEFLNQFLSTDKYWKWVNFISARSGQPGINGTEYASMELPIPPTTKEQKEIAACLATLDDRIALQIQRIEIMENHKKGLMQGLFPPVN